MLELNTFKKDNYVLRIFLEEDVSPLDNPRSWDNLGQMICFHKRYDLGDSHDFKYPKEAVEFLESKEVITYLPLYLMDHSGLSISTSSFSCLWDSGQVGWIAVTKDNLEKMGAEKLNIEKMEGILESEVKEYNCYLQGEVFAYRVDKLCPYCGNIEEHGMVFGGYLGHDNLSVCEEEGLAHLDLCAKEKELIN